MLQVSRINHARFETPDVARQTEYYTQVLGLAVAHRDKARTYLSVPRGPVCIMLEKGATPRCTAIGLQVASGGGLSTAATALTSSGIRHERSSGIAPGIAESLSIVDPAGTVVELVSDAAVVGKRASAGISPLKLGHIAFKIPDVQSAVRFYKEVLGFRVSDWRSDFFVFMRCGPDHHTVNFLSGDVARMHHIAFELSDVTAMIRACDHLAHAKYPVIWGPGRHIIGGNMFTYHRNPDQQIMELYAELAQMKSEDLGHFEPRPWHWDDVYRPKDWPADTLSNMWGPPSPPGFRD